MGAWEDGFAAGYRSASREYEEVHGRRWMGDRSRSDIRRTATKSKSSSRRRVSAYSKRYGAAFKRLAPKYKKKSGGWKKDGFKRCSAAARKAAKK